MESSDRLDLVVIGGGPGGYVAAIRAAQLGLRTALVDRDPLGPGGTCLWRGCIPTKAMLQSAETLDHFRHGEEFGVKSRDLALDIAQVHKRKDRIVRQLGRGVEGLLKKRQVAVWKGTGRIAGAGLVEVRREGGGGETLKTANIIIATGSQPTQIPIARFDQKRILSSDDVLRIESVPKSIVIVGAGAVGVEFASVFSSFGAKVTLVEMLPRVLPIEDAASSAALEKSFKARGIRVLTGAKLMEARSDEARGEARARLTLADGKTEEIAAEWVLIAVGRRPCLEGLGLEAVGIALEKGCIPVDGWMRARPGIHAIGDVVATPQLAHVASAEGILAVDTIAGKERQPLNYHHMPSCTYCHPEVASVGLTEEAARAKGYPVKTGMFPLGHLGRAMILGETEGFVKVVAEERYDEVLGIHIVGPRATDLIGEACAALKMEATSEEIARIVHPHPTLTEGYFEAASAVYGQAIHQ